MFGQYVHKDYRAGARIAVCKHFGGEYLTYFKVSNTIRWNLIPILQRKKGKNTILFPPDGFRLSEIVLSILIIFLPNRWRKWDLSSDNCLLVACSSSLVAEGSSSLDLVIWWPSFPCASWLKVHSPFLCSQTCHRSQVCWRLLGFSSDVVMVTHIYLPICVFRNWTPEW